MKRARIDMDTVSAVVAALLDGETQLAILDRFQLSQSTLSLIARRHNIIRGHAPKAHHSGPMSLPCDDEGLSGADEDRKSRNEIALAESMWPVLLLGERFDHKGRGHRP